MSDVSIPEVAITSIKYGDVVAAAKELKIQYVGKSKSKIALDILEEVEKRLEYIPEGEEEKSFSRELITLYNHLVDLISVKEEEENSSLDHPLPEEQAKNVVFTQEEINAITSDYPPKYYTKDVISTQEEIIDVLKGCEEKTEEVYIDTSLEEDKENPKEKKEEVIEKLPEENKTKQQEVLGRPKKKTTAYFRIKSLICEEILSGEVMWQTSKKKQIKRLTEKLLTEGIISKNVNVILYDFYHSITVLKEYKLLKEDFPLDFKI